MKVTLHAKRLTKKKEAKYIVSNDLVCAFPTLSRHAEFPNGNRAFLNFIYTHVKYPQKAIENNIEGKVVVKFFVNKAGIITDAKILNGIGFDCDEEVVKAIKLAPKWTLEIINSKPVVS